MLERIPFLLKEITNSFCAENSPPAQEADHV